MRRWRWGLIWTAAALVLLSLVLRATPSTRHPLDALLLLRSLGSSEEESTWLTRLYPVPKRLDERVKGNPLDLYLHPGVWGRFPMGCVLLVHGMTDAGRRDPRLVSLARSLARMGIAVAVPELPGMRRFRPELADVYRIAFAFEWLLEEYAPPGGRCAMFAFSFAAGPAFRAAALPNLRDRVAAIVTVGAYDDLRTVLRYLTTSGRDEAPAFPGGPPVRAGKWLFLRYNASLLGLGGHEAEVEAIVRRKLADENADISSLVERLPEAGRRVLALIENRDPARFDALYAALPAALRERLEAWSMKNVVPRTTAPVFLLHGRQDPFVPASESVRLAALARRRPGREVRLLVLDTFGHVDPAASGFSLRGAWETLHLLGFVSEALVVVERD